MNGRSNFSRALLRRNRITITSDELARNHDIAASDHSTTVLLYVQTVRMSDVKIYPYHAIKSRPFFLTMFFGLISHNDAKPKKKRIMSKVVMFRTPFVVSTNS